MEYYSAIKRNEIGTCGLGDVDGPKECHTEYNNSERERQIPCINPYMWTLEKSYLQSRNGEDRHRKQIYGYQGGRNLEIGIDAYTPLILCIQ